MRFIKKIPSRLITRLGIYQEPRRVSILFARCSSRVRSYRDDGGKGREWRREYKSVQRRETDINLRFRTKTLVGQSVCTESVRQTQWPNANSDQRPFRVFLRPPPSSSYPPPPHFISSRESIRIHIPSFPCFSGSLLHFSSPSRFHCFPFPPRAIYRAHRDRG